MFRCIISTTELLAGSLFKTALPVPSIGMAAKPNRTMVQIDDPLPNSFAFRDLARVGKQAVPQVAQSHTRVNDDPPDSSCNQATQAANPQGFGADNFYRLIHVFFRGFLPDPFFI